MDHEVTIVDVVARPTAVVPATTTWQEFPKMWRQLLDEVWACLRSCGISRGSRNIMLYWDGTPKVEVVSFSTSRAYSPVGWSRRRSPLVSPRWPCTVDPTARWGRHTMGFSSGAPLTGVVRQAPGGRYTGCTATAPPSSGSRSTGSSRELAT